LPLTLTPHWFPPTEADFKAMFRVLPSSAFEKASAFHRAVYDYLTAQGWKCVNEYKVADRGDGVRSGRIDIVIGDFGLELDNNAPRKHSQVKLGSLPQGGYILLRGPKSFVRVRPFKKLHVAGDQKRPSGEGAF